MEKRRRLAPNLFDREMKFLTLAVGLPTSFILFLIYWILLHLGFAAPLVNTFMFAAFGGYTLLMIFSVRSLRKPIFSYNPFTNPYLLWSVIIGFSLLAIAIYWPPLQGFLGTVALPPIWFAGVFAIGLFNILAIEFGKFIIRRVRMNENQ